MVKFREREREGYSSFLLPEVNKLHLLNKLYQKGRIQEHHSWQTSERECNVDTAQRQKLVTSRRLCSLLNSQKQSIISRPLTHVIGNSLSYGVEKVGRKFFNQKHCSWSWATKKISLLPHFIYIHKTQHCL